MASLHNNHNVNEESISRYKTKILHHSLNKLVDNQIDQTASFQAKADQSTTILEQKNSSENIIQSPNKHNPLKNRPKRIFSLRSLFLNQSSSNPSTSESFQQSFLSPIGSSQNTKKGFPKIGNSPVNTFLKNYSYLPYDKKNILPPPKLSLPINEKYQQQKSSSFFQSPNSLNLQPKVNLNKEQQFSSGKDVTNTLRRIRYSHLIESPVSSSKTFHVQIPRLPSIDKIAESNLDQQANNLNSQSFRSKISSNLNNITELYKKTMNKIINDRKILKKNKKLFVNMQNQFDQQKVDKSSIQQLSCVSVKEIIKNAKEEIKRKQQSQSLEKINIEMQKQKVQIKSAMNISPVSFIHEESARILAQQMYRMNRSQKQLSIVLNSENQKKYKVIPFENKILFEEQENFSDQERREKQEITNQAINQILESSRETHKKIMRNIESKKDTYKSENISSKESKEANLKMMMDIETKEKEEKTIKTLSQKLITKGLISPESAQLMGNKLQIQSYFMKKGIPPEVKKECFKQLVQEFDPDLHKHPVYDSKEITQMLLSMQPFYFQTAQPPTPKQISFYKAVRKVEMINKIIENVKSPDQNNIVSNLPQASINNKI